MNNVYHTDGYCSKNGSRNSIGGCTVFKDGKLLTSFELEKRGVTSNECELWALLFAIQDAANDSEIVTDSNVVYCWTKSGNPKARPDLKPECELAKKLIQEKNLDVYWASREENQAGHYNEERFDL